MSDNISPAYTEGKTLDPVNVAYHQVVEEQSASAA